MRKVLAVILVIAVCFSFAVAAAADNFVSSVTAKPAPEVSGTDVEDVIQIKNEDEKVVATAQTVKVEVTPVSAVMNDEAENISEESSENLKKAYEELSAPDVDIVSVVEGLDEVVKEQNLDASALVVKDLFDVTIHDENANAYLEEEGHTVDITFKADIQEGQTVIVAVFHDGKWILAKNVVVKEDGSIVATLEYVGTVAIIVA